MKFLDSPRLARLTSFLTGRESGGHIIDGKVEAYSCKCAGVDKKLSRQLEAQIAEELAQNASSGSNSFESTCLTSSPLGSLNSASTRKLLINLIQTLNASYPDYDFSGVRATDFTRESSPVVVASYVNKQLAELGIGSEGNNGSPSSSNCFLEEMWQIIDDEICLKKCEIFSYIADLELDPLCENSLWSFNFFFVNKEAKKILYFACAARSYAQLSAAADVASSTFDVTEDYDEEEEKRGGVLDTDDIFSDEEE